jgi:hypothetical protein
MFFNNILIKNISELGYRIISITDIDLKKKLTKLPPLLPALATLSLHQAFGDN